jgi:hypothetical protein
MISTTAFRFMALVLLCMGVAVAMGFDVRIPLDRMAVVLGYFNAAILMYLYTEATKDMP